MENGPWISSFSYERHVPGRVLPCLLELANPGRGSHPQAVRPQMPEHPECRKLENTTNTENDPANS